MLYYFVLYWFAGPLDPGVVFGPFESRVECWDFLREYHHRVQIPVSYVGTCEQIPLTRAHR